MKSLELLEKIENVRRDMIESAADKGYSSNEIIEISRNLDDLLNQYEKIKGIEN